MTAIYGVCLALVMMTCGLSLYLSERIARGTLPGWEVDDAIADVGLNTLFYVLISGVLVSWTELPRWQMWLVGTASTMTLLYVALLLAAALGGGIVCSRKTGRFVSVFHGVRLVALGMPLLLMVLSR